MGYFPEVVKRYWPLTSCCKTPLGYFTFAGTENYFFISVKFFAFIKPVGSTCSSKKVSYLIMRSLEVMFFTNLKKFQ